MTRGGHSLSPSRAVELSYWQLEGHKYALAPLHSRRLGVPYFAIGGVEGPRVAARR
jgi:hypothetical protein